jgi:hypothetical protein
MDSTPSFKTKLFEENVFESRACHQIIRGANISMHQTKNKVKNKTGTLVEQLTCNHKI